MSEVIDRLRGVSRNVLGITANCRPDMHEPDEQGVSAEVRGNHLDNAFGATSQCGGEYVVTITNDLGDSYQVTLCDLIAIARLF